MQTNIKERLKDFRDYLDEILRHVDDIIWMKKTIASINEKNILNKLQYMEEYLGETLEVHDLTRTNNKIGYIRELIKRNKTVKSLKKYIEKNKLRDNNWAEHKIHFCIASEWDNGFADSIGWVGANSLSTMYKRARELQKKCERTGIDLEQRESKKDFMQFGNIETYVKWEYNRRYEEMGGK